MNVGIMGMTVHHRVVSMPMRVRLTWRIIRRVLVLMMLVVHMRVRVLQRLVSVLVLVVFGEV
jgi:hypothetical protein